MYSRGRLQRNAKEGIPSLTTTGKTRGRRFRRGKAIFKTELGSATGGRRGGGNLRQKKAAKS